MLEKVKLALQITTNAFDSELTNFIDSAIKDLNIAGATTISTTDSYCIDAIIKYCIWQWELLHGALNRAEALKECYEMQKASMGMTTEYTNYDN